MGIQTGTPTTYSWQKEGWHPFFITLVSGIDKSVVQIRGTLDSRDVALYVKRAANPHGGVTNPIAKECIAHIREVTDQKYELSLVTDFGSIITRNAFTSLADAREDKSTYFAWRNGMLVKRVKEGAEKKRLRTPARKKSKARKYEGSRNRSGASTTVALAFAEAKKKKGGN